MSAELRETIKILQDNPLVKCGSYEFIGDSNITYAEIYILLEFIRSQEQENKRLNKQLDYLRSGEYYNQLKFERNMLQYIIDNGEVSKDDKTYIDCTHRNTELLEENQKYKEVINKAIKYIEENKQREYRNGNFNEYYLELNEKEMTELLDILKEVE